MNANPLSYPPAARDPEPGAASLPPIEWPTMALIAFIYSGWLAITYGYEALPLWVVAPVATLLITLQSSLQHEILHGHPTRITAVNRLFALPPLALWLPYERYRQRHLQHHRDERLTDPIDDTESAYWTPEAWQRLGPLGRGLVRAQQTLLGRMLIGPFWRIPRFLWAEVGNIRRNDHDARRVWIEHLLWCIPLIAWLTLVCRMPMWIYVPTMVVPAFSLLLVRSFAEHRAAAAVPHRIAIVERSWFFGPLFLFNNLHSLHHEVPVVPWYRYNARYRADRARLVAGNGGLLYVTYFDVARRFLLRPHDVIVHPSGRVPPAGR
jgi:fatty acid desaturase